MVKCPGCDHDNLDGARFCSSCGTRLEAVCPACGHKNAPGSRFCNQCGQGLQGALAPATLQPSAPPTPPSPSVRRTPEAERRHLTVMFCDLVGSIPLSQRLDPEDLRRVVRAYQEISSEIVTRYEGHLAQLLGDGLLVYFGYPVAHENDAERAVLASLAIAAEMPPLNRRLEREVPVLRSHPLQVRIGIHTGLVVTGEMGGRDRRDPLAVGETPNIVARLQGVAEPNTVVISGDTHRLVARAFACVDLGPHELKGIAEPVPIYRVLGDAAVPPGREEPPGLTRAPLVGRDQELGLLLDRWEQAKEGLGRVVVLTGEAGIGKSRLLRALKDGVDAPPEWRLYGRCSPYHQHSPLHPLIDLLQRALQLQREDSAEEKIGKIELALGQYQIAPAEIIPFLAALLSVDLPDRYTAPRLNPEQHRRETLEAILGVLLAMAWHHPLLLTLEDLHWVDPSTLELVDLLMDQVPTTRVLFVMTARPNFNPPWTPRSHLTHLTLSRFTRRHTEQIVANVIGPKTLPAEVLDQLVAKTDGVPLFVEELTKFVLESGLLRDQGDRYELTGPLPSLAIPSTLQDSLMARLDRLAPVKEAAQLGATIGRAFSYELLRAVSTLDDPTLQGSLAELVAAEMLYQRGLGAQANYVFKHALIQETAYQSLLKSTRQQYHQRIAQVLADRFPETGETQPELLARHFAGAGLNESAIAYWHRAGQRAVARSAYLEAVAHITNALQLLPPPPLAEGHKRLELDLRLSVGPALIAARGQATPEVERNYVRARELCLELGDQSSLFLVLGGLRRFHMISGDLAAALGLGEELLLLSREAHASADLVEAHYALGATLVWMGEYAAARAHLEDAVAQSNAADPPAAGTSHTWDTSRIGSLAYQSWALWLLGYPERALAGSRQALDMARQLGRPNTLVVAIDFAVALHEFRGEASTAEDMASEMITLCQDRGLPFWLGLAMVRRGWARAKQGRADAGIREIRQGIATWHATGARVARPFLLGLLGEALGGVASHSAEGLATVEEALDTVRRTREHFYEAELHRLRGELLSSANSASAAGAEESFRAAISIAQRQTARSLELRATLSLGRLWERAGRRQEARQLVSKIYRMFTEGFDTNDLREARAFLDRLS